MRSIPHAARAAIPFLAAAAIACDRPTLSTAPAPAAPSAAVVAELQRIGYRGPALVAERSVTDGQGTRPMARKLFLPDRGIALVRQADAQGHDASKAISSALTVASTPDNVDAAHNSAPGNLEVIIAPSRRTGRNPVVSTVDFNFQFLSYDYANDRWYIVPGGQVLESVILARDSSGGHWHGSVDTMQLRLPLRVGTLTPAVGTFTGSWAAKWRVAEVANEVNIRYKVREIGGPNDGETNWFYGLENDGVRLRGFVRIPENTARYLLEGGTNPHPNDFNDWGTQGLVTAIQNTADAYFRATSRAATPTTPARAGDRTAVNDMSLFYGGRFDVGRKPAGGDFIRCSDAATAVCWQFSHAEHSTGTEVDINPETRHTPSETTRFYRALSAEFPSIKIEGDHYHARTASSPYYIPRTPR